jgi:hypothetical protein
VHCGLRCPGDRVDAVLVVAEAHDGYDWFPEYCQRYRESIIVT